MAEGAARTKLEEQVHKAVASLRTFLARKAAARKSQLLDDDEFVTLVVALKKAPEARTNAARIAIPHSLHADASEICLIVKDDPSASAKRTGGARSAAEDEDEAGRGAIERVEAMPDKCNVAKVVSVSRLRKDFGQFEARRRLCASYDLFLADDRVVPALPKVLGKAFFQKKKHPVPVRLRAEGDWAAAIRKARDAAYLHLGGGQCCVVKCARSSMGAGQMAENVMAAVDGAAAAVPRGWKGVQALYLKTDDSVSLPLYAAQLDATKKASSSAAAAAGAGEGGGAAAAGKGGKAGGGSGKGGKGAGSKRAGGGAAEAGGKEPAASKRRRKA